MQPDSSPTSGQQGDMQFCLLVPCLLKGHLKIMMDALLKWPQLMAGCMLDVSKYLIKIPFHVYYIHVCVLYSGMYLGTKKQAK